MLTQGELEVMRILWDRGGLKPSEIQEQFPREIKNAALRFQLRILLEKGHVVRERVGKAYYYRAATPRAGAFRKMIRRLSQAFSHGSTAGLVAEIIKAEKLTASEIEELKQFAQDPKTASSRRKGRA